MSYEEWKWEEGQTSDMKHYAVITICMIINLIMLGYIIYQNINY